MFTLYLTWIALILGAAAATAALYGHYRVLPAWLTGPEVCLMEDGGCAVLFRSARSRLLGVPNALLGVVLYALLAVGLVLRWDPWLLFLMTVPAVAMSAFLGYSLLSRGLQCRICWTGHAANATLAVLLLVAALGASFDFAIGIMGQSSDPDALYQQRENIASAQQAEGIWAERLAKNPKDFESAWKLARARYWLGGHAEEERNTAATSRTLWRPCSASTRPTCTDPPIGRSAAGTSRFPGFSAAATRSPKTTCASRSPTTRTATHRCSSLPKR
jgi:uncharacterized membrane protein